MEVKLAQLDILRLLDIKAKAMNTYNVFSCFMNRTEAEYEICRRLYKVNQTISSLLARRRVLTTL